MKEGMSVPQYIPSKWIRSKPETGSINKIRPNADGGWTASKDDEPVITIKLVDSGEDGIPVGKIELNGNIEKFTVEYKEKATPNDPFRKLTFFGDDESQVR